MSPSLRCRVILNYAAKSLIEQNKERLVVFMENKTEGKGFWLILSALVVIAASSVYFVYKLMSDKAYNEKWQDYDECGIM